MTTTRRGVYRPKWSQACLCGSGIKYKSCCKHRLPKFDIGKEFVKEVENDNFEKALLAARADVCQYTIWHKTNTAPMLESGLPKELEKLLTIDVNALGECVERLLWLYVRLGRTSECPSLLNSVKENILHPWWYRKIAYLSALHKLALDGNRSAAKQELEKAGPITPDEDNIELLQIFIDLNFDELSFSDRMRYLDRILSISEARSDQLQYRGGRAIQYLMVGDEAAAEQELSSVVEECRATIDDDPLTSYELHVFARNIQLLATLRVDAALLNEAILHLKKLISMEEWTEHGEANLYRDIGDCHKQLRAWNEADAAYRYAISLYDLPIYQILLSEALLHQGKTKEAQNQIANVSTEGLEKHEFSDYVFVYSKIHIATQDKISLGKAKKLLEELELDEPYFREDKLQLLLRVTNSLAGIKAVSSPMRQSQPSTGLLATASSIFILKPNLFGVGININAIIDIISKKKILPSDDDT